MNGAKHGQKVSLSINVCKPRFYADLKAKQRRFLLMFKPNSSPIKVIGMVSYSQTLLVVLKVKKVDLVKKKKFSSTVNWLIYRAKTSFITM